MRALLPYLALYKRPQMDVKSWHRAGHCDPAGQYRSADALRLVPLGLSGGGRRRTPVLTICYPPRAWWRGNYPYRRALF